MLGGFGAFGGGVARAPERGEMIRRAKQICYVKTVVILGLCYFVFIMVKFMRRKGWRVGGRADSWGRAGVPRDRLISKLYIAWLRHLLSVSK